MLNCYCYTAIYKAFNCMQKKLALTCSKMLSTKCVYKSYVFNIYV